MAEIKHLIETDYKGNFNNIGERIETIEEKLLNPSYMKLTHENVSSFKVGTDSNGVSVALDTTNSAMELKGQTLVINERLQSVGGEVEVEGEKCHKIEISSETLTDETDGLVCHLKAGVSPIENNVMKDLSGNNKNLRLYNGLNVVDDYLYFDGVNHYAEMDRCIQDDFTIILKVQLNSSQGARYGTRPSWEYGGLFECDKSGYNNEFVLSVTGEGYLNLAIDKPMGNSNDELPYTESCFNKLITLTITRSKETGIANMYIDGKLVGTMQAENRNSLTTDNIICIGNWNEGYVPNKQHVGMNLYEIKLYDRVLDETEFFKCNKTEIFLDEPLRRLPNGVADTIEIKDGKAVITRRLKEFKLDGNNDGTYTHYETNANTYRLGVVPHNLDVKLASNPSASLTDNLNMLNDKFLVTSPFAQGNQEIHSDVEGICLRYDTAQNKRIQLRVLKSKITDSNIANGLKTWLQSNPITIVYEMATPIKEEFDILNPILYKDGHVFLETGAVPCSSVSHEVALNTKAQVKNNSKAIVSCRNTYNKAIGFYDELLLELDYDHTLFDFEYKMNKFGMEEV